MMIIMGLLSVPPMLLPLIKHPLSAGFLLLTEMVLIILMISVTSLSFWYSYIMFLIMIGGLLVMFMYMTSVASNEKFKFSKPALILTIPSLSLYSYFLSGTFWPESLKILSTEMISNLKSSFFSLNKFLNEPSYTLSILLIIYLLITLIAVIKIVNIDIGPIRHMN